MLQQCDLTEYEVTPSTMTKESIILRKLLVSVKSTIILNKCILNVESVANDDSSLGIGDIAWL